MDGRTLLGIPTLISNLVTWQHSRSVEHFQLSNDAIKIMNVPNAGGSSVRSEILSYEMIRSLFHGVELSKTEMEIDYYPRGSKKTDYSIRVLNDIVLGVSVTRAMTYFPNQIFTERDAKLILSKKLEGILWSTKNNYDLDEKLIFKRQILHVFAQNDDIAKLLEQEYGKLSDDLKSNTIVMITVTPEQGSSWLYYE